MRDSALKLLIENDVSPFVLVGNELMRDSALKRDPDRVGGEILDQLEMSSCATAL